MKKKKLKKKIVELEARLESAVEALERAEGYMSELQEMAARHNQEWSAVALETAAKYTQLKAAVEFASFAHGGLDTPL